MLHWLRNRKGRDRKQFWMKLLSVTCAAHGLFLIVIFFLYRDDSCQYNMTVNSKNLRPGAPIIFMPFHKVVNAQRLNGQLATSIGAVKATTVGLASPSRAQEKKAAATLASEKERKRIARQQARAKKLKEQKLKEKKQKEQQTREEKKRKQRDKKKQQEEARKKIKEEQQQEREREKQKAAEEKKQQELKQQEELKREQEKLLEKKQLENKKQDEQVQPVEAQSALPAAGTVEGVSNLPIEPVYMGQVEMEELSRQEELQNLISTYWRPPVGLQEGLECTLSFLVDTDGNATSMVIQKSSGVLVYDMAARMAVTQMQMPQWARGKELSITFV